MEPEHLRDMAREFGVQQRSIERALNCGVAEEHMADFLMARQNLSVRVDDNVYRPSIKMMAGIYRVCDGDPEVLAETVGSLPSDELDLLKQEAAGMPSGNFSEMSGIFDTVIGNHVAIVRDDWFEKEASVRYLESGTSDIEGHKRSLYSEFHLSVNVRPASSMKRIARQLTTVAFQNGFTPEFDDTAVYRAIREQPETVEHAIKWLGLKNADLRAYFEILEKLEADPNWQYIQATAQAHPDSAIPYYLNAVRNQLSYWAINTDAGRQIGASMGSSNARLKESRSDEEINADHYEQAAVLVALSALRLANIVEVGGATMHFPREIQRVATENFIEANDGFETASSKLRFTTVITAQSSQTSTGLATFNTWLSRHGIDAIELRKNTFFETMRLAWERGQAVLALSIEGMADYRRYLAGEVTDDTEA